MIRHLHETPQKPSQVVILGGTGFVGVSLVAHLKALEIETISLSSADIDLCDPESVGALQAQLQANDALVFISALTPDKGKDIRTLMKNLAMGEHVCAALSNSVCSQVVYVSSDAVYDDDVNPVRESEPAAPSSFHGLMHLGREQMLSVTLAEKEIPLLILRPSLLYGAQDTHNGYGPNRFVNVVRNGEQITLFGEGEEKRDHVYIEDVTRLIGLGLMHQSTGILNVATGTSVSFMDVARTVSDKLGVKENITCLPRAQPITHRHFDVTLTHQAYPSFVYTAVVDGLARTIAELNA
jgi:UDP-glucose 4-epimerase